RPRRDSVARGRKVSGATYPRKRDAGTLRKLFGVDLTSKGVHGSDSAENGLRETSYFLPGAELGRSGAAFWRGASGHARQRRLSLRSDPLRGGARSRQG